MAMKGSGDPQTETLAKGRDLTSKIAPLPRGMVLAILSSLNSGTMKKN
jgi:hypothetical protein